MASPCSPCKCIPYVNKCCYPAQNGIWVTMPQCHSIPGQSLPVNNPCFDGNKTYWSYNFFIECLDSSVETIPTGFAIPICEQITINQLAVFEKLSGSMSFVPRPFELRSNASAGEVFKIAPDGFQYLIIDIDDRYKSGICAEYRIEIEGDYPEATQDILIKRKTENGEISNSGTFIIPGTPPPDELTITKRCTTNMKNGSLVLNYDITVGNVGGSIARDVQLIDTTAYDGLSLVLGEIITESSELPLAVNSMPSMLEIRGQLGSIAPKEEIIIRYGIPVIQFTKNGTFEFTNVATVINNRGSLVQSNCTSKLESVELNAVLRKEIQGSNKLIFTLELAAGENYPESQISLKEQLTIEEGLTVELSKLGGYSAQLEDGTVISEGGIITANQGRTKVVITKENQVLTIGNVAQESIELNVMNISKFGQDCSIVYEVTDINTLNLRSDIFVRIDNMPLTKSVIVKGEIKA